MCQSVLTQIGDRPTNRSIDRRPYAADRHMLEGQRSHLTVLNEPEDVFKAVVVEKHSLQDWSVRAL